MNIVGILGGMGPSAGADFAQLFVAACAQHLTQEGRSITDQAFPEHWLAQVPVPDRTLALNNTQAGEHQPLEMLLQALGRLSALGVRSVAIACNTAHAWHSQLQQRFTQIEVLHMPNETARKMKTEGVQEVALMATQGTYRSGIYEKAMRDAGIRCHLPAETEREQIMCGIYQGVKADNIDLATNCFNEVVRSLLRKHGHLPIILGCTEIPIALNGTRHLGGHESNLGCSFVDPAKILAEALAQRAYADKAAQPISLV